MRIYTLPYIKNIKKFIPSNGARYPFKPIIQKKCNVIKSGYINMICGSCFNKSRTKHAKIRSDVSVAIIYTAEVERVNNKEVLLKVTFTKLEFYLNKIIGIIMISLSGEILLNFVVPEYINLGIGKKMLHKIEEFALTAKAFYIKNGFLKENDNENNKTFLLTKTLSINTSFQN